MLSIEKDVWLTITYFLILKKLILIIAILDLLEPETECQVDADCPSKLACFSGVCKDPCTETKPCIVSAKCSVIDTLPMRTMICECLPNFAGDATVACVLGKILPKKDTYITN